MKFFYKWLIDRFIFCKKIMQEVNITCLLAFNFGKNSYLYMRI